MTALLRSIFAALLLILASAAAGEVGRYRVTLNLAAHDDPAQVARQIEAITRGRIESSLEAGDESTFILAASDSAVKILATYPSVAHVEAIDPAAPHASPATWTTGTYAYDGSGNIKSITRSNFTEQYVYDSFGRLTSGSVASGRSQAYTYDRFGNILSITTDSGSAVNLGVNSKNNRMETTGPSYNITATYDGAGRLKTVPSLGYSFAYDGIDTITESTIAGERKVHLYTASDERVASISIVNGAPATWDWTIRDPEAKILRRFTRVPGGALTWTEDYVYRGSQMLAADVAGLERRRHFHLDHLGTPRLITGNGGTQVGLHTYYPFGVEVASTAQEGEKRKFTGHERDSAASDYLHARYYSAAWGRFLSVDPNAFWELQGGSDEDRAKFRSYLRHPQRWNRYAYVSNNPINKIDPDGREENFYMEQLFREQQMVGEGKMTEDQYWARRRSEGYGALIGTAGAGGWLLGARAVTMGYTAFQAWRAASAAATTIKMIEQTSRGDARIFQTAMNFARGSANNFTNNLTALSRAVEQVVGPQGRITQIGTIGGQAVWGSARTGYGITAINGVTKIVQMIGDDKYRIIGNFR
jgi:RHS repeat-associated protein